MHQVLHESWDFLWTKGLGLLCVKRRGGGGGGGEGERRRGCVACTVVYNCITKILFFTVRAASLV